MSDDQIIGTVYSGETVYAKDAVMDSTLSERVIDEIVATTRLAAAVYKPKKP